MRDEQSINRLKIIIPAALILLTIFYFFSTKEAPRHFTILAMNDVYQIEPMDDGREGGFARLKTLRDELKKSDLDLITLHGGDFLSPSILGQRYKGAQMIDIMNRIDGDAAGFDDRFFVVPGNHEFDDASDDGAPWLHDRISESDFWWLSSNINWQDGNMPNIVKGLNQIVPLKIIEANGVKIGLFGLTLERDETLYAPIDGHYVEVAKEMTKRLRAQGAEVVIALTHLFVEDDLLILSTLGENGPDIIFGGHEHVALKEEVGGRYVVKADSDLKSVTIAKFTLQGGRLNVDLKNKIIDQDITQDPAINERVQYWVERYNEEECGAKKGQSCDNTTLGITNVELVATAAENRLFETNLGNWLTDTMFHMFEGDKAADIAFLNSGAVRINANIAAGSTLTKKTISEILPYETRVYLIQITGTELKEILNHSLSKWQGNGYWLQVSGLVFRQNIENESAEDIHIIKNGKLVPLADSDMIKALTVGYLLNENGPQDGYRMIGQSHILPNIHNGTKLQDLIAERLLEAGAKGIAPQVEGRICNPQRPQFCLLDQQ